MSDASIQVVITVINPEVSDEEVQATVENLKTEFIAFEGIENISLIPIKEAPPNSKGLGGFLLGKLDILVKLKSLKNLVIALGKHLFGSAIEIEAKGNGRYLKVRVSKPDDLKDVLPEVERFING